MSWDQLLNDDDRDFSLAHESATDGAIRLLQSAIFSGELGPGARLPPERELAARLGMSRLTLRVALKSLESAGYIVTTRGAHGGSRVNDVPGLLRCWRQWMLVHWDELEDIFELRITVESRIAWLAAERRTAHDLKAIEMAVAAEDGCSERNSLLGIDMDIHKAIARASHSSRLKRIMVYVRTEVFLPVDEALREHRERDVHASHLAILSAIRDGDRDRASVEMRSHLYDERDLMRRALEASDVLPSSQNGSVIFSPVS
jgi:DNA-binding FadR family transcriptional regulator